MKSLDEMSTSERKELMDQIWTQLAPVGSPPPKWKNAEALTFSSFDMIKDYIETILAINRGLDDVKAGRVKPAEQVFWELEEKFGIPHEN